MHTQADRRQSFGADAGAGGGHPLLLKGEGLAPAGSLECLRSLAHGHVEAVLTAMRRLGFDKLIDGRPSRERGLGAPGRRLADGTPALSFGSLLAHLSTVVHNTMRCTGASPGEATFSLTTRPAPKQQQALDLAAAIAV